LKVIPTEKVEDLKEVKKEKVEKTTNVDKIKADKIKIKKDVDLFADDI
jgi:hypothetical protein